MSSPHSLRAMRSKAFFAFPFLGKREAAKESASVISNGTIPTRRIPARSIISSIEE